MFVSSVLQGTGPAMGKGPTAVPVLGTVTVNSPRTGSNSDKPWESA